jgi:eukaryotic-like serine/threonine-protein kinase
MREQRAQNARNESQTGPMNEDRWADVESVFSDALALDADARRLLLDARCAGRPAMRAEVESLLASHDRAGSFLQAATIAHGGVDMPRMPDLAGEIVGRFRLLERIGEGGMGVVYRAERADGEFSEQAAVKLLTTPIHTAMRCVVSASSGKFSPR